MSETGITRPTPLSLVKPKAEDVKLSEKQSPSKPRNRSQPRPSPMRTDPDRFLMQAKAVAVQNYNEHKREADSPDLTMDTVHIVSFSATFGNWKAVVASTVVKGLIWDVSYSAPRKEIYLDIWKRAGHLVIPQGEIT